MKPCSTLHRCPFYLIATVLSLFVCSNLPATADNLDVNLLYKEKCSKCHVLPDPHNLTAQMWDKQMETMALLAQLHEKQKAEMLAYLKKNSGTPTQILAEERKIIEKHCSSCHVIKDIPIGNRKGEELSVLIIEHLEDLDRDLPDDAAIHEIEEYFLHKSIWKNL